ncbi:hypothetical protein B0H14DRAFT_3423050 [Mycena olivaceomarginata]|nr:hypothetical protein B0H14DRAFT_3423050 [Mycena olivaceomarginata]
MPLPHILAFCPTLTTITFNADWRLVCMDNKDTESPLAYECLTNVSLHDLAYVFGVGFAAAHMQGDPFPVFLVTSANDRMLTMLLLEEFDRADGPMEEGMACWEQWWEACNCAVVRLEDCTGALLEELLQDPPKSDSKDEDDNNEKDEENGGEEGSGRSVFTPQQPGGRTQVDELQQLLAECHAMDTGTMTTICSATLA